LDDAFGCDDELNASSNEESTSRIAKSFQKKVYHDKVSMVIIITLNENQWLRYIHIYIKLWKRIDPSVMFL